jgi:hypothetical protein
LLALTLQNGLAEWNELTLGPTYEIGITEWPAPIGNVKLFGDVTPYGNLMRQLVNSKEPNKPLLAGFRYDNYAYIHMRVPFLKTVIRISRMIMPGVFLNLPRVSNSENVKGVLVC